MLKSEWLHSESLNSDTSNLPPSLPLAGESRAVLHGPLLLPRRPLHIARKPALVWRSPLQVSYARTPHRTHSANSLRLVPAPRRTLGRPTRPATTRTRLVESAYLAAALVSAVILWWTAR